MANPFPQDVHWALQPTGPFLSFDGGPLQARIYQNSGHIELAGPNLAGASLAEVVRIAPPTVQINNNAVSLGAVISSHTLPDGLELKQHLGAATITTRLTFPHDGVLRYEVTDFAGVIPSAIAIASPSGADEHFYGFGEKFATFDQAGKNVHILTFDEPGIKHDRSYKVAPWFISTRGYGFHLDSSAESAFDMRASAPDRYVVTSFFSTLRFHIVYGPQLTAVLTRFTGYTRASATVSALHLWSLDFLRYLAEWRRGALRSHAVPAARHSCFSVCFRLPLGSRLQRFPV